MVPIPNISASSSATSGAKNSFDGAAFQMGGGTWNLNLGGSGTANFAANSAAGGDSSGPNKWILIGGAVLLVLVILK